MPGPSRRRLLIAGIGSGIVAAGGVGYSLYRFIEPGQTAARDLIAKHFGESVAVHPETSAFLDAYMSIPLKQRVARLVRTIKIEVAVAIGRNNGAAVGAASYLERALIPTFLRRTNVVRHLVAGDDLLFAGSLDVYEGPCVNFLAAPSPVSSGQR